AAIFAILNVRMVKKHSPTIITFYEMIGAFVGVSLAMFIGGQSVAELILSAADWVYLLLLGSVCTALAYALSVAIMKELSAFAVALATNMEPVYGILIALLIFGSKETMSMGFYIGAVIVLSAVFLYPSLKTRITGRRSGLK